MSGLELTKLMAGLSPGHIVAFFLVLARIAPLFVLAPLFSSPQIPVQVRTVVAVGLAVGLTAVADHGRALSTDPLTLAALLAEQLLIGLAFSLAVGVVLASVTAAGSLLDVVAGFSFGALLDPINGGQGGGLTNLYAMVGTMLFIGIGGDAWTLRGLARTFALIPLGRAPALRSLTDGTVEAFGTILLAAVEVAAPVLLALLITDVAFGVLSRVIPQLNVFAVGFPTKLGVSLLLVSASLPFLGGWISNQIADSVLGILHWM